MYRIYFFAIRPEPDFAGFAGFGMTIRPEPDFQIDCNFTNLTTIIFTMRTHGELHAIK